MEKDPSRAEIGPLAGNPAYALGKNTRNKTHETPSNMKSYVADRDGHTKEAVDHPMPPEDEAPGDYSPVREKPDLDGNYQPRKLETDTNIHSAPEGPDNRSLIRDRVSQIQIQEDGQELLQEEMAKRERQHEAFLSTPSDPSVDRRRLNETYSQHGSVAPVDSNSSAMPKSASDPLSILERAGAHPIRLMLVLDERWDEWVEWEFETIAEMAAREGLEIDRVVGDKIMALKNLRNTEYFWMKPRVFEKICLAFADKHVDWGHIQEPRVEDLATAVALVDRYIAESAFEAPIASYVAACAAHNGFLMLPGELSFAQDAFSDHLLEQMGDEALTRQTQLLSALEQDDPEQMSQEDAVQYMRLVRCQQRVGTSINELRG